MKNGKRPTKRESQLIEVHKLNPRNWLIFKNLHDELHLVHRDTGTRRVISK
ncbi:DUF6906 family protein [Listeria booriae]|uniref:DUF6906 family protein n=1 Tax=Listeria booriae TaxID=1552123 RepID=UPI001628B639|nr:hypothetical protein [Listeria booriae]MBC2148112.1 hypothetical protein [Listeria booriae]MBC2391347.1 hypothetical protein [Listeria booriae]